MSTKYKFQNPQGIYFVTFAVIEWIDLFVRNEYREIILDSWRYCMNHKGMDLYAWVIMTSHLHMIMGSHDKKPENILRDMKRWTSGKLREAIANNPKESRREWLLRLMKDEGTRNRNNNEFQLWRQDNHPIELYTPEVTHQKLDYLHFNPVEAGFVVKPEDYLYSSASDYYIGKKGPIEVQLLDPIVRFH